MADICSYSSYVRDTRDEAVSRRSLTSFASKTRYRIINDGGMLYQFLGDSVVGLFGIPERDRRDIWTQAVECARGLVGIGASVAAWWQRQIDQIQPAAGLQVSMTIGDLQVLSLRPLSRAHMGVIGDSINLAAAPQQRRRVRRDRREQHVLPVLARRAPRGVPGAAAGRCEEHRPYPRLEARAAADSRRLNASDATRAQIPR